MSDIELKWNCSSQELRNSLAENAGLLRVSSFTRNLPCWHELNDHWKTELIKVIPQTKTTAAMSDIDKAVSAQKEAKLATWQVPEVIPPERLRTALENEQYWLWCLENGFPVKRGDRWFANELIYNNYNSHGHLFKGYDSPAAAIDAMRLKK